MLDTDRDTYDLGLRLRELRQAKGLSQEQVARQVGVSKGPIYRYESNLQEPSLRVARRLARVLGTSLDYLGGLENQKTIRIPNLPAYQEKSLLDFIEKFAEEPRKDGNPIDYA